jgi:hypothetical protein
MPTRIRGAVRALLLFAAAALAVAHARAQPLDPGYLVEMPSVERVLAEIDGRDERATAVRRVAAFSHLRKIVESLAGGRLYANQLTSDEKRIIADYNAARFAITNPIQAALTQENRPSWFSAVDTLELSDDYRNELLDLFFSERWAKEYLEVTSTARQNLRRSIDSRQGIGASSIAFELAPAVRNRLRLEFAIAALLVALALWRETRPFGPDRGNPLLLRAGLRRYTLSTVTGAPVNYSEETRRFREGRRSAHSYDVTETTDTTVSFTIQDHAGGSVQFVDERLSWLGARNAKKMSAVLATRMGKRRGVCVTILNHDDNTGYDFEPALRRILKPWLWPVLPALWLVWTWLRMSSYSERENALFAVMFLSSGALLWLFYLWRNRTARKRIERFQRTMGAPLRERLFAQVARAR